MVKMFNYKNVVQDFSVIIGKQNKEKYMLSIIVDKKVKVARHIGPRLLVAMTMKIYQG